MIFVLFIKNDLHKETDMAVYHSYIIFIFNYSGGYKIVTNE